MKASRTRFNRDQTILTTFDSGKLIPFYVDEVLPGDTFSVDTTAIIRMTTPKYPVMDDAFIDFYYFYCPNRILWDNFKHFMGEVETTPWMPKKEYAVPKIKINGTEQTPRPLDGSILDYMGVPTKVKGRFSINALPIRAYVMIWNEFFRDQNVENEAVLKTDDADIEYTETNNHEGTNDVTLKQAITGARCLPVNKFHDYFTSCLPYPQRGPTVGLPMTGNAPIRVGNTTGNYQDFTGPVEMVLGATSTSNKPGSLTYGNFTGIPGEKKGMQFTGTEIKTNDNRYRDWETDRKSTRLNSSHSAKSRMPSSA